MINHAPSNIFLNSSELTIIHFIASRPELLSKIGYRFDYILQHVSYSTSAVRRAIDGLMILGLVRSHKVTKTLKGRKPLVFLFDYPVVSQLSENYRKINNFTTTPQERNVASLMLELSKHQPMSEMVAAKILNTTPPDVVVQQYSQYVSRIRISGRHNYSLTPFGLECIEPLKTIQELLATVSNSNISR